MEIQQWFILGIIIFILGSFTYFTLSLDGTLERIIKQMKNGFYRFKK
jgi:hypothetical protein